MIIFKEIFANIIYINIFTVLKKCNLLLMTVLPSGTSPWHVLYMDTQGPPLYLLGN